MSEEIKSIIEEPFYPEDCTDIRAQKNSKRIEKIEEKIGQYDSLPGRMDDVEEAVEDASEEAAEAKGLAQDASGAVDTLKTALNGVYAFVQFNKTIAVADWSDNEATVESVYLRDANMITIEPAVDDDGGNTDNIVNAGITPLAIETQGEITFVCKDTPTDPVIFTFVIGIPIDLTE